MSWLTWVALGVAAVSLVAVAVLVVLVVLLVSGQGAEHDVRCAVELEERFAARAREALLLPYAEARVRALADLAAFGVGVDEVGPYDAEAIVPASRPVAPLRFEVLPESDRRLRPLTAEQEADLRTRDKWGSIESPAEVSKSQGSTDAVPAAEGGAA